MKVKKEYLESVIFLIIAGFLYYLSVNLPQPPPNKTGPGFFPKILIAGLVALAFFLIIKGIRRKEREELSLDYDIKDPIVRNRIIIPCAVALYIYAMIHIGFLISTFLFSSLLMLLFDTNILKAAALSAFIAILVYYVFIVFMVVPLPTIFSLPGW